MEAKTLKGRGVTSGRCKGKALVSSQPISFLGGIDPNSGRIIEKDHDLKGECVKGKVLCFPHGHGSTVGSYVLYSLTRKGLGPRAIINQLADPVVVVGAIIAGIPMVDKIDIQQIKTGDEVGVDGDKGLVKVLRR